MSEAVLTERRDGVLIITINRPEARNAINLDVAARDRRRRSTSSTATRELALGVLTGAGSGFSAGMDLKAFAEGKRPWVEGRGFAGIVRKPSRKPLIAAIEGFAVAGGLEVALACDLLVAARGAKLGTPEAKRGLVAAGGALLRLPRRIPYHFAMEMALTGDLYPAERLYEVGLVNRIAEPGQALDDGAGAGGRPSPRTLRCRCAAPSASSSTRPSGRCARCGTARRRSPGRLRVRGRARGRGRVRREARAELAGQVASTPASKPGRRASYHRLMTEGMLDGDGAAAHFVGRDLESALPPEPTRRIFAMGGGGFTMEPEVPALDHFLLSLTGKREPRLLYLPTASGDPVEHVDRFHAAYDGTAAATTVHVAVPAARESRRPPWARPRPRPRLRRRRLDAQHAGVWRAHGLDAILREAWEHGIVLAGLSAGAMCWFAGGITRSGGRPAPIAGLGLLPYSFSAHRDGDPDRLPAYREAVRDGSAARRLGGRRRRRPAVRG